MNRQRIVVVGSSFAGFTAAMELKEKLGNRHDVTVVSKSDQLLLTPSLVLIPFGLHSGTPVTFDLREPLEQSGVRFLDAEVRQISLANQVVTTGKGDERYDYLLVATGSKPNYAAIPGLGPRGYTQSIVTLAEAERARSAFERFLEAPGPVVVGAAQGAPAPGFVFEFLFHMGRELERRGVADRAPLSCLSAEPTLRLMTGDDSAATTMNDLFDRLGIRFVGNASIRNVDPKEIVLADGRRIAFAYAMIVPPFLGADVVRACERITDASGFVRVNDRCQTFEYPRVFAAGAAVALSSVAGWSRFGSVAETGKLAEETARTAAHNIAALIEGREMSALAIESAGPSRGRDSDKARELPDRPLEHERVLPGPGTDWARTVLEKYSNRTSNAGGKGT